MSYCRRSDQCTVYAYRHIAGYFEIHYGGMVNAKFIKCDSLVSFKNNLLQLREEGELIPDIVFERIDQEI